MKTDRELLELAAKAAERPIHDWNGSWPVEYVEHWSGNPNEPPEQEVVYWNPLTDDGDALRLAAGLCLNVLSSEACVVVEDEKGVECIEYMCGPEDYTSGWRRAIVRAAAAIGEGIE